jgi:hypothetical protein
MTVVRRSPDWGENNAPRIINPSKYITVTEAAIKAPRPGRLSSACPAPGISHASTTAGNHLEEEGRDDDGAVTGLLGKGVTGKPAPGVWLTQSFYSIRACLLNQGTSQPDPHSRIRAA